MLHNESDQEVHADYLNGFSGKISGLGQWTILDLKMMCPHN